MAEEKKKINHLAPVFFLFWRLGKAVWNTDYYITVLTLFALIRAE